MTDITIRNLMDDGKLKSSCLKCNRTLTAPNKGMGRATLAAWESGHGQNCLAKGVVSRASNVTVTFDEGL